MICLRLILSLRRWRRRPSLQAECLDLSDDRRLKLVATVIKVIVTGLLMNTRRFTAIYDLEEISCDALATAVPLPTKIDRQDNTKALL